MGKITKAEMRQRLGNIGQLRELLFGEEIEKYEAKIEQYNHKISQIDLDLQEFKTSIEKRLGQLESKLVREIDAVADSLEKQIQYIQTNNQEEHKKLDRELKIVLKHSNHSIGFLQNSINDYHSNLKLEITQSKVSTDRNLQLLKRQIFQKLESNLAELSTTKLSHNDLAEVLFELCLKLKDPKASLELLKENQITETDRATNNNDLILPEHN